MAGAAAAFLAVAAALSLFRIPPREAPAPARPHPVLGVAPLDPLLAEQTGLYDPTPLFLPTRWNSRPAVPAPDPGAKFGGYPPRYQFTSNELAGILPAPIAVPANAPEALVANPPGNPLEGIGRTDASVPALPARGAFVEVVADGTGRPVLTLAAPGASPPGGPTLYRLEFTALVDAAGLAGPLQIDSEGSSAPEAVSAYFERYLSRVLWIGDRLAPGSYRIRVGP